MMSDSILLYQKEEGVASIILHRPQVFNALNAELNRELLAALKEADHDPEVRAVVLTGSGKAFCSGQDLKDQSAMEGPVLQLDKSVRERYNPLIEQMYRMEKPTIAAVNGVAAGAGCSLALACDLRMITPQTKFVQAFVKIGLVPDSGATYFLPRLVGTGRALELLLTGRDVDAKEAMEIGLANKLVPVDELEQETLQLARQLAQGPTKSMAMIRKLTHQSMESTLSEMLELEAVSQGEAGRTHDFLEGIRAFSEKRPPKFQGK